MKSVHQLFSQSGCRICGKLKGIFVNVLEKKNKRYLLQIRKFFQVEISSSDDFSKYVCHTCIGTMNDFALLFEQCQVIQQELNKSVYNGEILRNENLNTDEMDDSSHQNPIVMENEINHKSVFPNLIILNEQLLSSEGVEWADEGESSAPLSSESDIAINQGLDSETYNNANDFQAAETNSGKASEESNQSNTSESDRNWRIQKLPNSETKLYLCNKCSSILLCEEAKQSHTCYKIENSLDISEDSPKKLKLES